MRITARAAGLGRVTNLNFEGTQACSARLQAGMCLSVRCPSAEADGRYKGFGNWNEDRELLGGQG